jgi:hypothetical protein
MAGTPQISVESAGRPLAQELAQRRLEYRARSLARTLVALRALADVRGAEAPRPLQACIEDLERELTLVDAELSHQRM